MTRSSPVFFEKKNTPIKYECSTSYVAFNELNTNTVSFLVDTQ